ncbi:ABC transporter substrate-binding protein [Acuticoccus sp. I52.16.1]|uniref:ABC transporter substrate-binding protein n=1 Tax=Acuticoccus sp. I52.16.1 TaxID=2928472 RepID=UPI001FD16734|nr:ABC transporter substrate-binding protein [Acuticoccus sp. I52.16.1]UOM35477.1 ABC transporter substrate-binding protein [Acuticoccus sp. I52.16.1]
MTRTRNTGVALAALAATIWMAAAPARADDPIVVGLAIAESGFMVAYDGDSSNAVKLWIDNQNEKGGLLGREVSFVTSDTKSDRVQGAKAGQDVVREGADLVVVSCDYDFGAPAAIAAQQADIVSMFLCAEDPKAGIEGAGKYAFTSSIAAQVQGATMAEWAAANLDMKTAYVLLDTTIEYDKSVCAGFDWAAGKMDGLEILGSDTFKNDDPSIQSQITRIKSLPEAPDAIMLCTYVPGGASAVRQLRASGLDMPILNGSSMDGTYWTDAVPDLTDFYIPVQASIYGDDPREAVQAFNADFEEKFGRLPVTQYTYPAYAWLELWAKAVEEAGSTDADKVVPIMETYTDAETILGPRTFSDKLHIQNDAPYMIVEVKDNEHKVVDEYRVSEPVPYEVLFRLK